MRKRPMLREWVHHCENIWSTCTSSLITNIGQWSSFCFSLLLQDTNICQSNAFGLSIRKTVHVGANINQFFFLTNFLPKWASVQLGVSEFTIVQTFVRHAPPIGKWVHSLAVPRIWIFQWKMSSPLWKHDSFLFLSPSFQKAQVSHIERVISPLWKHHFTASKGNCWKSVPH